MIKKQYFILQLFIVGGISFVNITKGQDSIHKVSKSYDFNKPSARNRLFTISYDPMQGLFTENLFFVEYGISSRITVGVGFGNIHPLPSASAWFSPGFFITSPTGNGYGGRLYLKWYLKKKPNEYLSIQFAYKKTFYNNSFYWQVDEDDDDQNDYIISDGDVTVFGIDVLDGHEFSFFHGKFLIDVFYGIGFREKLDVENLISVGIGNTFSSAEHYNMPIGGYLKGVYDYHSFYPTPILGFKVGYNIFLK